MLMREIGFDERLTIVLVMFSDPTRQEASQ